MKRASALVIALAALACRKSQPSIADAAPAANATTTAVVDPPPFGDPLSPDARALPELEKPRDNLAFEVDAVVTPGTAGTVKVDPFEGAISAVRQSSVGCFAGQPPGEYSAVVEVAVTPSGKATRAEATYVSIDDADVKKCLEQAALSSSYPITTDGRKLSIDVTVKG